MGQFAQQPDFITKATEITKSDTIDNSKKLNGAAIYVGTTGDLNVIMVGVTKPGHVTSTTDLSGGAGYTASDTNVATTGGSGTGLTVNTTVVAGAVTVITINNVGEGYKANETITISGGTTSATFLINGVSNFPIASQAVEFVGIPAGTYLPVSVDYVLATDTTAGSLLACY